LRPLRVAFVFPAGARLGAGDDVGASGRGRAGGEVFVRRRGREGGDERQRQLVLEGAARTGQVDRDAARLVVGFDTGDAALLRLRERFRTDDVDTERGAAGVEDVDAFE